MAVLAGPGPVLAAAAAGEEPQTEATTAGATGADVVREARRHRGPGSYDLSR